MIYILSPINIPELVKIKWECDKYGNRSDTNGNYYDYEGFMQFINIDPFVLTTDKEEFNSLKDAISFFYPNVTMYESALKKREFNKMFPFCWLSISRAVHFKKIEDMQDTELKEHFAK